MQRLCELLLLSASSVSKTQELWVQRDPFQRQDAEQTDSNPDRSGGTYTKPVRPNSCILLVRLLEPPKFVFVRVDPSFPYYTWLKIS